MDSVKNNYVINDQNAGQLLSFEHVNACLVCGGDQFVERFGITRFGITFVWVKCRNCSFVFQPKRLTQESLGIIYQSLNFWKAADLKSGEKVAGYDDYLGDELVRLANMRRRLKKIKDRYLNEGNLLDIGTASGTFIKEANRFGFVSKGIEVSCDMARIGRERDSLDIIEGDFEDHIFPASHFDIITMWNADNIFKNPLAAFKKVRDCLRPGGYFIFNYFDNELYNKIMRGRLSQHRDCHSLYILNAKTIMKLLEKSELRYIKRDMQWGYIKVERLFTVLGLKGFLKSLKNKLFQNKYLLVPMFGFFEVVAKREK